MRTLSFGPRTVPALEQGLDVRLPRTLRYEIHRTLRTSGRPTFKRPPFAHARGARGAVGVRVGSQIPLPVAARRRRLRRRMFSGRLG
jgi:hypothetical protein